MKQQKTAKNGFTIIEVVLVLAIAGLIFLMVFIALPALQRNQRDTQRKDDVGRFMSAINSYQSNNRGSVPETQTEVTTFVQQYLLQGGDSFVDPSGAGVATIDGQDAYTVRANQDSKKTSALSNSDGDDGDLGRLYYFTDSTCDGDAVKSGVGSRKVAVRMVLEGGGIYCSNN